MAFTLAGPAMRQRQESVAGVGGTAYRVVMYETEEELAALDALLARSRAGASAHLRAIVTDDRAPDAAEVVRMTSTMRTLAVATVTARGEPRISALDGHFLHGTWTFGTEAHSVKAGHLARRPAVSVAWIDGEAFGVFAHGSVRRLEPGDGWLEELVAHWTRYYGDSPESLGDVVLYRLEPSWMVAFRSGPVAPAPGPPERPDQTGG